MSRFLEWFIAGQINSMGWPRPKGLFRRPHVDSVIVDTAVELGLQTTIGLGAGRPEIAIRLLADIFSDNPWTEESTAELLTTLRQAVAITEKRSVIAPWKALWSEYAMAPRFKDIRWGELDSFEFACVRSIAAARAVYWGLTNEEQMLAVFQKAKSDYENTAVEANQAGLGVNTSYAWYSLDHFYATCDKLVRDFQLARPSL